MFDLGRLRVLRELRHRGTLARVAEALAYSPSTISQQLSQLEREVGVPLLVPDGRGVRLTAQAELLVGHVERILRILDEAEADIAASLGEVVGEVRLGAFQTAAASLLPAAVEALALTHPRLRVLLAQVGADEAVPALRARDFDLVVTEDYPGFATVTPDDLDAVPLTSDELALVLPDGDRRSLRDLGAAVWVLEPDGSPARQWADSVCRSLALVPDVRFVTADLRFQLDLVRRGHAIALLPGLALAGGDDGIARRRLPGRPRRSIHTVTRAGSAQHPAVLAVRAALACSVRPG